MTNTATSSKSSSSVAGAVVLCLGIGIWATYGQSPSEPVDEVIQNGRDAVFLHYIKHAGWGPIRCNEGAYEGRDILYCHASGNPQTGGLHVIRRERGEPVVLPINGTAMGQMRQDTIEAIDGGRVTVREWDGPLFDIPKAIEATL